MTAAGAGSGFGAEGSDADARRRARILDAARRLFLKKGIRRTPVEDIARTAGIAKGSVYLSFPSKDALFGALAIEMTEGFLQEARRSLASETDIPQAVTAYLEAAVGVPGRDLFSSPHAAELLTHKTVRANGTIAAYEAAVLEDMEAVLRVAALPVEGARQMVAAAHGVHHMTSRMPGGGAEAYRANLLAMVLTLLAGFEAQATGVAPKTSAKVD